MNFNAYGYGPPDDRKWIVVDCGVLFGRETTTPGVDLIMPDIRFLAEQRENVLGIVLTHAHEDHIGAIGASVAAAALPALRDAVHRAADRRQAGGGGLARPRARASIVPLGGKIELGPFEIEFITITHSIPEPNALAIRTPLGRRPAHRRLEDRSRSAARRSHRHQRAHASSATRACWRMVCDSTNALVHGQSGSEARVRAGARPR